MLSSKMSKILAATLLVSCTFADAIVVELIQNGSFTTGDLTGWTMLDQMGSQGEWFIYSSTIPVNIPLPLSSYGFFPQPNGTYGVVTDQYNPSTCILYQNVTIPANSSQVTLQFSYAYVNYLPWAIPPTLDYTIYPNQQYRIDIMTQNPTDPFSVLSGDVLLNLITPQDTDLLSLPYTTVSYDLSQFAGQTIGLRFAVADNEMVLNLGIDGVSITATVDPAPNPPVNLRTSVKSNRFLSQSERSVILNWDPSSSTNVVAYRIYKNGVGIATVQGLCYQEHNVCGNNVYQVTAIDSTGSESTPI